MSLRRRPFWSCRSEIDCCVLPGLGEIGGNVVSVIDVKVPVEISFFFLKKIYFCNEALEKDANSSELPKLIRLYLFNTC